MGFDKKLPIKERIKKRRRQKRRRLLIFLSFVLISVMAFVAINNALSNEGEESAFSDIPSVQKDETVRVLAQAALEAIPGSDGLASSISTDNVMTYENNVQSVNENSQNQRGENETTGATETAVITESSVTDNLTLESSVTNNLNYDELKSKLEKYISQFKGQYGIYYMDLWSNEGFGINDTDEYIAASTVKVPLNYYVFKKIADGEVSPKQKLTYTAEDFEEGTGILQTKKLAGKSFEIKYLLELSITHSDNIATNMLLRHFGRKNLRKYMKELGGEVVKDDKNVSCPKDMALYLEKIYEFCNSNEQLGQELKYNLCNTVFNDRLPKLLPEEVEVAHKVGNQIGAVHDVGIIYTEKPYILAVMSKGVISDEEANNVIAQVSKMVYDYVKDR